MKFSAKTRYAARILLLLAQCGPEHPVPSRTLAKKTGISQQFIEQILRQFRLSGITLSVRGAKGGHILAYSPDDITFGCIVKLMEGGLELAECRGGSCAKYNDCDTRKVWRNAQIVLEDALESVTLEDFLRNGNVALSWKKPSDVGSMSESRSIL